MRLFTLAIAASAGCTQLPSTPPPAAMPWLHGFATTASSDTIERGVADRMNEWRRCEDPCMDVGGIELRADVIPGERSETILATYSGLVVLDSKGLLVARGPGFEPTGSADELLAVAVGDATLDAPIIAVAARVGGRREHAVWLELYRVGPSRTLERIFAAATEQHDDQHAFGSVTLVPGGLIYKAPRGTTEDRWTFDSRQGRYRYGDAAP
jgi:hypothetical protein